MENPSISSLVSAIFAPKLPGSKASGGLPRGLPAPLGHEHPGRGRGDGGDLRATGDQRLGGGTGGPEMLVIFMDGIFMDFHGITFSWWCLYRDNMGSI